MANFKNTTQAPERLTEQDLQVRLPLELEWLDMPKAGLDPGYDARIRLSYQGHSDTFAVEYKRIWTAAALSAAIEQARRWSKRHPGDLPMVVLPYLSSEMLNTLLRAEVNGLDLVGNGVIYTPDWFLLMDGQPNSFKNTQVIKSPYQGKSALVARTLLSAPLLYNAEDLRIEIRKRGGEVSQPMVSRALKAFRDDLIVGKQGEFEIVLLQPEKLLDRLVEQWRKTVERWRKSSESVLWRGRIEGNKDLAFSQIFRNADKDNQLVMFTGIDAALVETFVASEPVRYLYANSLRGLFDNTDVQDTKRFPSLEVQRPPEEAVFFDSKVLAGLRWPSQLQSYLELTTEGVRLEEGAKAMRQAILTEIENKKDNPWRDDL